jgi:hypothetical protein
MAMSPLTQEAPQLPTPPTPPAPPLPQVPDRVIRIGGPDGMTIELPTRPLTGREVAALRQRGSELSRQLNSANNRRDQLAGQLEDAEGANKAGIEARIAQLDQRIMGIESDIAQNGRLLASAPASALANANSEARVPFGLNPNQVTGISIVGIIGMTFIALPMSIAIARNMWRRASGQVAAATPSRESAQRMERLEQAVDAIAIEIERISEGQRFVTRVLAEGSGPALPVGQEPAEAVRLSDREPARASRESA